MQIAEQYPYKLGYGFQWLMWAGNYAAANLPTTYGITASKDLYPQDVDSLKGLMGRLVGGGSDSNSSGSNVYWLDASGQRTLHLYGYGGVGVAYSTFTLAPIVQ